AHDDETDHSERDPEIALLTLVQTSSWLLVLVPTANLLLPTSPLHLALGTSNFALQGFQVLIALPDALQRIARRLILLDDAVLHAGGLRDLHDGREVQGAAAHFDEGCTRHRLGERHRRALHLVLQVHQ